MSKDQTALMTIDGLPTATIPQTWRYKANDPGYYALNSLHPTQVAGPTANVIKNVGANFPNAVVVGTKTWNDAALFRTGTTGGTTGAGSANQSGMDSTGGAAVVRDVLPAGNVLDTPWSTATQASAAYGGVNAAPGGTGGDRAGGEPGAYGVTSLGSAAAGNHAAETGAGFSGAGQISTTPFDSHAPAAGWGLGGSLSWEANSPDIGAGSGLRVDPAKWTFGDIWNADGTTGMGGNSGDWVISAPPVSPGNALFGTGRVSGTWRGNQSEQGPITEEVMAAAANSDPPNATGGAWSVDYLPQSGRDMLPAREAPSGAPTSGGGRKRRRKRRKSRSKKGWAKRAPRGRARTRMLKKCGKKCFLGPKKSFPICAKRTCKINRKGVKAAYIRAKQWGKPRKSYKSKSKTVVRRSRKRRKGSRPRHRRRVYTRVARKAKSLLRRMKR